MNTSRAAFPTSRCTASVKATGIECDNMLVMSIVRQHITGLLL